jgi:hypothetical protein
LSDVVKRAKDGLSPDALNMMWLIASPHTSGMLASIEKSTDVYTLRKKASPKGIDSDSAIDELERRGYVRRAKESAAAVYLTHMGFSLAAHIKNDSSARAFLFDAEESRSKVPPDKIACEYDGARILTFDKIEGRSGQYFVQILYRCKNGRCGKRIYCEYELEEATRWEALVFSCHDCGYQYRMHKGCLR